ECDWERLGPGPCPTRRSSDLDGLPAGAVPVDVAVLQLHPGTLRGLGDEPDLDLTGVVWVGLDLPLRADIPAEHHTVRWLVGQHPERKSTRLNSSHVSIPYAVF